MITVRRIRVGESDLFRSMRLASLQDAPYAFSSTYNAALQRSSESWQKQADATARGADRATFIVFSDDAPVGLAALYRLEDQTDTGEVLQVWVHPGHRGTSAARYLMNAVIAWASENNFREIMARITDGNTRALHFYARYGFSVADRKGPSDPTGIVLVKQVR